MIKSIIGLLVLLVTLNVNARSMIIGNRSELFNIETSEDIAFTSGHLEINYVTSEMTISLSGLKECGQNEDCQYKEYTEEYNAPLNEIKKDACGVIVFKGQKDDRPVDGVFTEIEVKDTTKSPCEIVYPAPLMLNFTKKYVNRFTGRSVEINGMALGKMFTMF